MREYLIAKVNSYPCCAKIIENSLLEEQTTWLATQSHLLSHASTFTHSLGFILFTPKVASNVYVHTGEGFYKVSSRKAKLIK